MEPNQRIDDNEQAAVSTELLRMLDRGIDDMEAGHELPLDQAMNMVDQLLARRRAERMSAGSSVGMDTVVGTMSTTARAANG